MKGGQGCSVTAAAVAIKAAEQGDKVLLVDLSHQCDMDAVLGMGSRDGDLTDNLSVIVGIYPMDEFVGYDKVVIDWGTEHPSQEGLRLLVTKACYLSLRASVSSTTKPDGVILVREEGRALQPQDVAIAVGSPIWGTVPHDPQIARTVDAGLMAARLPRALGNAAREILQAAGWAAVAAEVTWSEYAGMVDPK